MPVVKLVKIAKEMMNLPSRLHAPRFTLHSDLRYTALSKLNKPARRRVSPAACRCVTCHLPLATSHLPLATSH